MHSLGKLMGIVLLSTLLFGVAAADLPAQVGAQVTAVYNQLGAQSYWNVYITNGYGSSDLPTGSTKLGWCVDSHNGTSPGTYTFPVYSSLTLPLPSGLPAYLYTVNWNKVNYILNNKAIGNNNLQAIQAAIWHYDGGIPTDTATYGSWFTSADYNATIAAADANGGSFIPGPGQKYSVMLYIPGTQCIMIEVPVPNIPVPEFPMLAVPVILLVAVVYLVSTLKKKNK